MAAECGLVLDVGHLVLIVRSLLRITVLSVVQISTRLLAILMFLPNIGLSTALLPIGLSARIVTVLVDIAVAALVAITSGL